MEITESVDKVRSLTATHVAKGSLGESVQQLIKEAQNRGIEVSGITVHSRKVGWDIYLWGDVEVA